VNTGVITGVIFGHPWSRTVHTGGLYVWTPSNCLDGRPWRSENKNVCQLKNSSAGKIWLLVSGAEPNLHLQSKQEAHLSPRDRAMRRVSWNLANCHATVRKLLVWQVLNKSKLWSRRVKVGRCVIKMCTQPWRLRVAFIVYRCHKQTDDGRVVYITCIPTTCCGEIF